MSCFVYILLCVLVFVDILQVVTPLIEEEKQPSFLTAAVGGHVAFNCQLDFPQDIEIPYILKWNKEGTEIFSVYDNTFDVASAYEGRITWMNSEENGFGKGSVNLTNIRETDTGWYECKVFFRNRTPATRNNGTWFYLTVDGGNLIAIPPTNQTVLEGAEVTFVCVAKKPDTTVKWYKNGVPLDELTDLHHRSFKSADGSLTINPTTMSDLGEYQCMANNGMYSETQTARAFLNVQYKAKVIYAPAKVFFPYGKSAILECHYRANPPLSSLQWMKDGYLFDPYNVQGVFFFRRNGSLLFSQVNETHNGHYSCTPYNSLGTDGPSPLIEVIVQKPPVFTVKPHNMYLKKLGETVDMHCDAIDDGVHKPLITWSRKDGLPLPPGRVMIQGGNISIEQITEDDRGVYECNVTNEAATISAETELSVENVAPRAPYNLSANSSDTSVTLEWVPGYIRPYMEYNVWYRPSDSAEWKTMRILSMKTTMATITNLSPGKQYEFMVLSKDKQGDGMFSKPLKIFTKGAIPTTNSDDEEQRSTSGIFQQIGPPMNVTVQLTIEGYLVTWSPPIYGKEHLKTYIVKWTQGPDEELCGRIETRDLYCIVKQLEENETYYFQVFALSVNDYQAGSSKFVITVPAYRRIRAVSIGIVAGVALVGATLAGVYYAWKKWGRNYSDTHENMSKSINS